MRKPRPPCTFSATLPASIELLGRARFRVGCMSTVLARPVDRPGAPWEVVSRGDRFVDLALPAPGRWEVRVANRRFLQGGPSQVVSVGGPVCASTRTIRASSARARQAPGAPPPPPPSGPPAPSGAQDEQGGETVSECVLIGPRWPEAQRPSRYVLQWLGDRPLSDVVASRVAVYFHGDGGCCFDGYARDVGAFAIRRNMLLVNAVAPVSREDEPDSPTWPAGDDQLGYDVGYDLRQIGGIVGTDRFLYWSHSGGSVFLSAYYVPTGLRYARGPLALNCGGAAAGSAPVESVPSEVRMTSPLLFGYGSEDFLTESIEAAVADYSAAGWNVSVDRRPDEGHCTPDFAPTNIAWFESVLEP